MADQWIDEVILLAAGLGTRLKPVTDVLPKPLVPLFSVPLIQSHFDAFHAAGIRRVIVNVHHLSGVFRQVLQSVDSHDLEVVVSDESALLLDSGGGLVTSAQYIRGARCFWVNADNCLVLDWKGIQDSHREALEKHSATAMTMVLKEKAPGESYRGIIFDRDTRRIAALGGKEQGSGHYFLGAGVIEKSFLNCFQIGRPYEFVRDLLSPELSRNTVFAFLSNALWLDIGSVEGWYRAHRVLLDKKNLNCFTPRFKARIQAQLSLGYDEGLDAYIAPQWTDSFPKERIGRGLVAYSLPPDLSDATEVLDNGILFEGKWLKI